MDDVALFQKETSEKCSLKNSSKAIYILQDCYTGGLWQYLK